MAKKIIGIYQITCTVNGKRYVGQSIDIKRRFNQHRRKPSDGVREDFELYGVDKFTFEVLEECAPEELTAREDFYLDTLKPEYNIRTKGHGISDEAREKLRLNHTGKKRPDISRRVKCVETGEVFESLRAAAKWCNVPSFNLCALLSGKGRTFGGYHWIYADEDEEAALERIRQMPEKVISPQTKLVQSNVKPNSAKNTRPNTAKKFVSRTSGWAGTNPLTRNIAEKFVASRRAKFSQALKTPPNIMDLTCPTSLRYWRGVKNLAAVIIGNTSTVSRRNIAPKISIVR